MIISPSHENKVAIDWPIYYTMACIHISQCYKMQKGNLGKSQELHKHFLISII